MVDPLKLRDMISLAEFDEGEGQKDLRICETGKWNYILFAMIRTFLLTGIASVLAAGLFVFVQFDYVMDYLTGRDLVAIGILVLAVFLCVEVIWLAAAGTLAAGRYREAEERVSRYRKTLRNLCDYSDYTEIRHMLKRKKKSRKE